MAKFRGQIITHIAGWSKDNNPEGVMQKGIARWNPRLVQGMSKATLYDMLSAAGMVNAAINGGNHESAGLCFKCGGIDVWHDLTEATMLEVKEE